jgi:O-antigen/teichoic acid export membrane protein
VRGGPIAAPDLLSTPAAGSRAIRGGALRVASFSVGALFGIVSGALIFRYLGVDDAGKYTTALSLAAIVTGFTDLGLTAVGMRELATLEGDARARMAANLLGIRLVLTVTGVTLMTLFALLAYGPLLAAGVLVAGAGVLVTNIQVTLSVPLMAGLRLGWVSSLDLARVVISTAIIALLVLAGAGLLSFLATSAVAAAIVLVPTALLVRGEIPLRPSFDVARWRVLLQPVLTYSIAVAAATLYFRVAIVLVSLFASAQQLGYFSLSFRIVEVLFAIPGLLVGAAFPIFARAARDDPERLGYALSRVFEVSLIVGAAVSLMLAVGADFAVAVIGGPEFAPSAPILAIAGLGLGATFVSAVWGYGMLSLHLHRLILVFALGSLLAVVVVVSMLVSLDGARGAAIGTSIVEIGVAIVSGVLLVHGRPHLRPRLTVVPKVACAGMLGATAMLATGISVPLRVVVAMVAYVVVLLALRAFPDELVELLPRRVRR